MGMGMEKEASTMEQGVGTLGHGEGKLVPTITTICVLDLQQYSTISLTHLLLRCMLSTSNHSTRGCRSDQYLFPHHRTIISPLLFPLLPCSPSLYCTISHSLVQLGPCHYFFHGSVHSYVPCDGMLLVEERSMYGGY